MKIDIRPKQALLIILFVLLVAYSLYEARFLILGPQIWIENPQNGQVVTEPLVVIQGRSRNIAWISLNDRQIFTDEKGEWSEKLIVSVGTSIMTVKAQDRLGRKTEKSLQVVLK